jgi:hypothetical protein
LEKMFAIILKLVQRSLWLESSREGQARVGTRRSSASEAMMTRSLRAWRTASTPGE